MKRATGAIKFLIDMVAVASQQIKKTIENVLIVGILRILKQASYFKTSYTVKIVVPKGMESEMNIKELRLAKKVLLRLIDDSYDTLRNCPEARQDPSNIHATVKELKGAIDEIDRHISMEDNGADT